MLYLELYLKFWQIPINTRVMTFPHLHHCSHDRLALHQLLNIFKEGCRRCSRVSRVWYVMQMTCECMDVEHNQRLHNVLQD